MNAFFEFFKSKQLRETQTLKQICLFGGPEQSSEFLNFNFFGDCSLKNVHFNFIVYSDFENSSHAAKLGDFFRTEIIKNIYYRQPSALV